MDNIDRIVYEIAGNMLVSDMNRKIYKREDIKRIFINYVDIVKEVINEKEFKDSCYKEVDKNGVERWFNKDHQLHRGNDLPAIIYSNDYKAWYKNGKQHRNNDLPAIIYADGSKAWYKNGEFIK
jgi:hypothetical protein